MVLITHKITTLKLVSWNVNSILKRRDHFLKSIQEINPDVILLQETRCGDPDKFIEEIIANLDYSYSALDCQERYNGVAILSKYPLNNINITFPGNPYPLQARYMEATVVVGKEEFLLINIYVPHGEAITKLYEKCAFINGFCIRLRELGPCKKFIIIGGDFNIDPDKKLQKLCCSKIEQKMFARILRTGLCDGFRALNPNTEITTKQDTNLRLDHFLISRNKIKRITNIRKYSQAKKETKKSKHAPIICKLKCKTEINIRKRTYKIVDIVERNNNETKITRKQCKNMPSDKIAQNKDKTKKSLKEKNHEKP